MRDREAAVARAKKYLKFKLENKASEAEVFFALERLEQIKLEYGITDEELQEAKEEKAVLGETNADDKDGVRFSLMGSIERFTNTTMYRTTLPGTPPKWCAIGHRSDADYAIHLLTYLTIYVEQQAQQWLLTTTLPAYNKQVVAHERRNFLAACTQRISDRLVHLTEDLEVKVESNGRELMVLKREHIKAYMSAAGIKLGKGVASVLEGFGSVASAGAAAGYAAGNRVQFGRPVSGAGAMLRLGRSK
jgi:hypothetical protein